MSVCAPLQETILVLFSSSLINPLQKSLSTKVFDNYFFITEGFL